MARNRAQGEPEAAPPYGVVVQELRAQKREIERLRGLLADQQALQNQVRAANQRADEAVAAMNDKAKRESVRGRWLEIEMKKVVSLELRIGVLNGLLDLHCAPRTNPAKLALDSEQWRRLVQLCHPDKHNGSEASVKESQWLQENRP